MSVKNKAAHFQCVISLEHFTMVIPWKMSWRCWVLQPWTWKKTELDVQLWRQQYPLNLLDDINSYDFTKEKKKRKEKVYVRELCLPQSPCMSITHSLLDLFFGWANTSTGEDNGCLMTLKSTNKHISTEGDQFCLPMSKDDVIVYRMILIVQYVIMSLFTNSVSVWNAAVTH